MVAQVPDRRTGRLAGAAGIALLLVGLTLLLEPASRRAGAAALLAVGLAAGVVVAMRLPASGRPRTPMERLNDGAFVVVVAAISLVAVRLARPWTAALPGLVGGFLIGLASAPTRAPQPPTPTPGPGPGRPVPPAPEGGPGAGTPPPVPSPPEGDSSPSAEGAAPVVHTPQGPDSGGQVRSRITTGMSRRVLRW